MRLEHMLIVAVLALIPGCAETAGPQRPVGDSAIEEPFEAETPTDPAAAPQGSEAPAGGVTIAAVAGLPEIEQLLAQRSGKVVVVDLWALW